jgi:HIV Tat-specific factor 1
LKQAELKKEKRKRYKENKKKKWYNCKMNTSVYVSGLPQDITIEEIDAHFTRCGIIRLDPHTGEKRIKVYTEKDGAKKGDALISYAREESLDLALEHLNESEIKPGFKIHVERVYKFFNFVRPILLKKENNMNQGRKKKQEIWKNFE